MIYFSRCFSCFARMGKNILAFYYYTITNYTLIIDIYFYERILSLIQILSACTPTILDTLSNILDMCLRFSLIKIESVSLSQAKPCLVPSL